MTTITPEQLDELERLSRETAFWGTEQLVRARNALPALIARIRELEGAVAAERERCAKIVEEPWEANSWVESDSEYLARRIRAG